MRVCVRTTSEITVRLYTSVGVDACVCAHDFRDQSATLYQCRVECYFRVVEWENEATKRERE